MNALWVDTDFGFDDIWALLLLRSHGVVPVGISLVAGNAVLPVVEANALGAAQAYGFDIPMYSGEAKPLKRQQETAERIFGPRGMQSRGRHLPVVSDGTIEGNAVNALQSWLTEPQGAAERTVLALGPLTNIAKLIQSSPEAAGRITRLVWMGGSNGPGNHSAKAEFNALADPEAAAIVSAAGLALDVIDLMICRQALFSVADLPHTDALTADLLGGYLDIGLSRGRSGMAIYDPVAALALLQPDLFVFERCGMQVSTVADDTYGETRFDPSADARTRLAVRPQADIAQICLNALATDERHGA